MAYNKQAALPELWAANPNTLEFILKCAGYKMISTGIEHGWHTKTHGYWFCDDGDIEYRAYGIL